MKDKKIVFMGTPDFAVNILEGLIDNGYNVVLVVSQPDKMVGRKRELRNTPVKECALKNGIEVYQPINIKNEYDKIVEVNPDIIITCAYGQIIPKVLIDLPELGCVNVHASLLPKYRGGAPIHKVIMNGESKTGVTIMYMDVTMDTGDIISCSEVDILDSDNVGTLHDKLALCGSNLLLETLPSILDKSNGRVKQDHDNASYGYNVSRDEERIDFSKSSREVFNHIRGLNPWPMAYCLVNGEEFKVLDSKMVVDNSRVMTGHILNSSKKELIVKTSDGAISLLVIKPFGKKIMNVSDYLNGVNKEDLVIE